MSGVNTSESMSKAEAFADEFLSDLKAGKFDGYWVERYTEGIVTEGEFNRVREEILAKGGTDKDVRKYFAEKYGVVFWKIS